MLFVVVGCSQLMGDKDPHQPGAPLGVYSLEATVDVGRSKGKITIEFASLEDLDRIAAIVRGDRDS